MSSDFQKKTTNISKKATTKNALQIFKKIRR